MPETYWRVRMLGTGKALRQFLSKHPNDPHVVHHDGDNVVLELLIAESLLAEAEQFGTIKRLYNATEVGRARQSQVGTGNRFAHGEFPLGLGLRR